MTNDERLEQFAAHVQFYAEALGLDRRYLVIQYDPELQMQGQAHNHRDYLYTQISIGAEPDPDFPFHDPEVTAAHEIIHVAGNDMRQWMYQTVRRFLPKKAWKVLIDQYEHEEERFTEILARGMVAIRRGDPHPGRVLVRTKGKSA